MIIFINISKTLYIRNIGKHPVVLVYNMYWNILKYDVLVFDSSIKYLINYRGHHVL